MSWVVGESGARIRVTDDAALNPWVEAWSEEDPTSIRSGERSELTLPFTRWGEAGEPPVPGTDPEVLDLFRSRHQSLARLLRITRQHVGVETVGHIGAPNVSFLFSVDGKRVGDSTSPIPFVRDGVGVTYPLVPCAYVAYERLCRWNERRSATRPEQLVFIGELRDHLDRSVAALGDSFSYELDPHLSEFRIRRAGPVALSWRPQKNGKLYDLEVEEIADGALRTRLDLRALDPDSPLIAVSATEHILLEPDVEKVARVAKRQANKLRERVERHFANPATILPEGVSLEGFDLSAYGPRVAGFAPIVKAERFIDIKSSGTEWYRTDGASTDPFLRLAITQPGGGGVELLELATPEEAEDAAARMDHALGKAEPDIIKVGGRSVQPTKALVDCLRHDLAVYHRRKDATESLSVSSDTRSPRLAAVIREHSQPAAIASDAPPISVPWALLDDLLEPTCMLKRHQREGIEWLWRQYKRREAGVLLADDMGLGKTLQISAFMAMQRTSEPETTAPNLIVCPVILLANWQVELQKFFKPSVFGAPLVLHGETLRRLTKGGHVDLEPVRATRYVLANYETLQAHQQSLLMVEWNVVVLDESHAIKNPDTYRARAARGLKRRFAICSTGTPVENQLSDLWGLYDFLSPNRLLATLEEFKKEYESDVGEGIKKVRIALGYPGTNSSLLRRTKIEVLDLPAKSTVVHRVEMTAKQVELERQITRKSKSRGGILQILHDLQKLYQHPRLLLPEDSRATGVSVASLLEESPKLALCMRILREIKAKGEKALVFTMWTEMQALLVEVIKHELGLPHVRVINGDGAQRKHVPKYLAEFDASDGFDVLVLSPLAAGTGLTITAANHVIHYGRWWNPAKEDQATDRAYRIGQTRPVRVHYPLLTYPGQPELGFDVKLHGLVERKREMAVEFLAPMANDFITAADLSPTAEAI